MKRRSDLPELLAPAGDLSALIAAVEAGADAVYVGGKQFGARAFAKNFDTEDMRRAVRYCHTWGVRLYVTVNTMVLDREVDELMEYVSELYAMGVDALIVSDLGVARLVRAAYPDLELHASTQMSLNNSVGADAAADMGICRVVLARELSFENITSAVEKSRCEIEVFMHGALCVSHSGQCLMSAMVGGRSANRGECAQPCRLPYNNSYPISLKDLCLAEHINELIECGVASLKIEGRMKSPAYVSEVTRIYRRLLDEQRCADKREMEHLARVFSRDGFTDGYFAGKISHGMTGIRRESDKTSSRELSAASLEMRRRKVSARCVMRLGAPASLTLFDEHRCISVEGDTVQAAQSVALDSDSVKARLCKMGNTYLSLSPQDIELTLDDGVNLSISAINDLRRRAAGAFELGKLRAAKSATEKFVPDVNAFRSSRLRTALFFDSNAYSSVALDTPDALKYFDICFLPLFDIGACKVIPRGAYLPPVITDDKLNEVKGQLLLAKSMGVEYALVGNLSHVSLAREAGLVPLGDFRLNVANRHTRAALCDIGVRQTLLSAEVTLPQIRDIGGGVIVYGRIPLMLTERCFISENFGCSECGSSALCDRTGARFPMIREYEHRNIFLNSKITSMSDKQSELAKYGVRHAHFIFTVESAEQICGVVDAFKAGMPIGSDVGVRRVGVRGEKKNDNR